MILQPSMLRNDKAHLDCYRLYGITVRSTVPLDCPKGNAADCINTELSDAPASMFRAAIPDAFLSSLPERWFRHVTLPDGTDYLRWSKLFEFLISPDGRRIACHALRDVSPETFEAYLVSQTLSFALLKQGIEPLHATAMAIGSHAVAFLGDCGYGKSSLGAAFLRAGHRLLTDDLLVITPADSSEGRLLAHPGPARIKLFPEIAERLLGARRAGVRMNPDTNKLIIPLANDEHCRDSIPLRAIYVLRPPTGQRTDRRISIRPLSLRRACIELIANAFNLIITDRARLARQFRGAARLASAIPVKSLSYPRNLAQVSRVVTAIQSDASP